MSSSSSTAGPSRCEQGGRTKPAPPAHCTLLLDHFRTAFRRFSVQACFSQRWRPWVSTGGPFSIGDAAFYNNDPATGADRWQVLNPSVGSQFNKAASLKWGKFVNSTHAFQVRALSVVQHLQPLL